MKILILCFILLPTMSWSKISPPYASTGFEAGVARLSDGDHALIGTSWMYHFSYHTDPILSFFGQAGNSSGKDDGRRFSQTAFTGGLELHPLPVLSFRFGFATTMIEIEEVRTKEDRELGPMVAAVASLPVGVFNLGTSATIIRTESMHSSALRAFLFILF